MKQQRHINLDILRILACFLIVLLHALPVGYNGIAPTSVTWTILNVYEGFVRCAIPMFFMLSGLLFLSKEEFSIKKLFTKNILKLAILYFLWCTLYAVDTIGVKNLVSDFDLYTFAKAIVNFKYHLWYLPAMISVYMLVPVLRCIRNKDQILKYTVIMFLIFAIGRGSLGAIPQLKSLWNVADRFTFAFAGWSGYFILGYYLYKKRDKIRFKTSTLAIALAVVLVFSMALQQGVSILQGKMFHGIYDNNFFITNAITATILLLLFLRMPTEKIAPAAGKWIGKISKYTLLVYLLHPFVLEHLSGYLTSIPFAVSVPILAVVTFAICLVVAFVIDLIPGVNKWLV